MSACFTRTFGKSRVADPPVGWWAITTSYPFSFAIQRSAASTSMPNSARRTFLAGTLIVVSEGISDCFASRRAASKMSWVSIARGSDWDEIRPSASRPADAGQRLFVLRSMRCGGRIISDISPKEIARAGVLVRIPPALRSYTDGQDEVVLEATDVAAMLRALEVSFPGIRDRVVDEAGRRRPYVNVFVNEELIRASLPESRLNPGDVVHILPSVAGGWHGSFDQKKQRGRRGRGEEKRIPFSFSRLEEMVGRGA